MVKNAFFLTVLLLAAASSHDWLPGAVAVATAAVTVTIAISIIFRVKVRRRTAALSAAIAELQQSREEVRHKNEALEKALAARGQFFSMISHEIKTPLTVIVGYTEMLKHGKFSQLPERADRAVSTVLRRAQDLQKLIDDLLEVSQLDRDALRLEPEAVSVRIAALETLSELQVLDLGKPVSMRWEGEDVAVVADRARLRQILGNLCHNAVKYSRDSVDIVVTTARHGDRGTLTITDNGIGITPEDLDRIFDRFYRGKQEPGRPAKGSGLGLAITRELVNRMNGAIDVTSTLGRGSSFTVRLPLAEEESSP